jgi:iron complex transport system permease protein
MSEQPARARLGPYLWVFGGGLSLLVALLVVHLTQGSAGVAPWTVVDALVHPRDELHHHIVRHLRLPRALAGVLAGGLFATAGLLLQTATRNPLASPATLGVNGGAYLAVVATAALAPGLGSASPVTVAFLGGLLAAGLSILVAGGLSATPVRLALAGMAVAMASSAGAAALQILFEHETAGLFFWGAGALLQDGWDQIQTALPRAGLALLAVAAMSRSLDVLSLGDDAARSLGQRVKLVRVGATGLGVLLAASAVALTGPIGFVGLVAPHLVRLMGIRKHLGRFLGSLVWGPVILVGADVLGRVISAGASELPAGVVTAMLGTPFLVYLARRVGDEGVTQRGQRRTQGPAIGRRWSLGWSLAAGSAGLLAVGGLAVSYGAVDLSLGDLWRVVQGVGEANHRFIVLDLRLPRVAVAALAGGCLALSGLLLQGVVRNPLAAPDIVGVMSGAGVGAMVLLLAFPSAPVALLPVAAFAGAVLAFGIVYAASWQDGVTPERLALVGIGVAAFGEAVINTLVVRSDMRLAQALSWLSGSTYAQGWGDATMVGGLALAMAPAAFVLARNLDLLALGDASATGLGLPAERSRLLLMGLAVALAAAAVSVVGTVGFIGLVAPHAARLLVGGRHRRLVPVAFLFGAIALVGADLVGRVVLAPQQIPSGLVAAVLGAPYFVWLLRRTRS